MANIKLTNDNWETSGVYDLAESKTQRQINADLKGAINSAETSIEDLETIVGDTPLETIAQTVTSAINALNTLAKLTANTPFGLAVVSKSGFGYSTITAAINNTNNGDTILIMPGQYEEELKLYGKKRNLIGIDTDNTIIFSTGTAYGRDVIQIDEGSIQNLTIRAGRYQTYVRENVPKCYAIHSDETGDHQRSLLIKNCKIYNTVGAAIGFGVRYNQNIEITNCLIETSAQYLYSSVLQAEYPCGAMYCHTDGITSGQSMLATLVISYCEFHGIRTAVLLRSMENGTTLTIRSTQTVYRNNTTGLNNNISKINTTNTQLCGSDIYLAVYSWNNNIAEMNAY